MLCETFLKKLQQIRETANEDKDIGYKSNHYISCSGQCFQIAFEKECGVCQLLVSNGCGSIGKES